MSFHKRCIGALNCGRSEETHASNVQVQYATLNKFITCDNILSFYRRKDIKILIESEREWQLLKERMEGMYKGKGVL